jgi:hypothetical protein
VDVVVKTSAGVVVANATVQATHAAGTGCTAGETVTATTRTDTTGKLRLALPYGTWTIRATTTSGSPTRTGTGSVTLDPVSTAVPTLNVAGT